MRAWAMFGAAAGAAAILGLGLAVSSAGGAQPAEPAAAGATAPAPDGQAASPAPERLGEGNPPMCWGWTPPGPPPATPRAPPSCFTLPDDVKLHDDGGLYSKGQLWCPAGCVDLWQGRFFCCAQPPY